MYRERASDVCGESNRWWWRLFVSWQVMLIMEWVDWSQGEAVELSSLNSQNSIESECSSECTVRGLNFFKDRVYTLS